MAGSSKGYSDFVKCRGLTPEYLAKKSGFNDDTLRKKFGAKKYRQIICLIEGVKNLYGADPILTSVES